MSSDWLFNREVLDDSRKTGTEEDDSLLAESLPEELEEVLRLRCLFDFFDFVFFGLLIGPALCLISMAPVCSLI